MPTFLPNLRLMRPLFWYELCLKSWRVTHLNDSSHGIGPGLPNGFHIWSSHVDSTVIHVTMCCTSISDYSIHIKQFEADGQSHEPGYTYNASRPSENVSSSLWRLLTYNSRCLMPSCLTLNFCPLFWEFLWSEFNIILCWTPDFYSDSSHDQS